MSAFDSRFYHRQPTPPVPRSSSSSSSSRLPMPQTSPSDPANAGTSPPKPPRNPSLHQLEILHEYSLPVDALRPGEDDDGDESRSGREGDRRRRSSVFNCASPNSPSENDFGFANAQPRRKTRIVENEDVNAAPTPASPRGVNAENEEKERQELRRRNNALSALLGGKKSSSRHSLSNHNNDDEDSVYSEIVEGTSAEFVAATKNNATKTAPVIESWMKSVPNAISKAPEKPKEQQKEKPKTRIKTHAAMPPPPKKKSFRSWGKKAPYITIGSDDNDDQASGKEGEKGSTSPPKKPDHDEDTFARAKKEPKRKGVGKNSNHRDGKPANKPGEKTILNIEVTPPSPPMESRDKKGETKGPTPARPTSGPKDEGSDNDCRPPMPTLPQDAIDRSWQRRRSVWQIESPDPGAQNKTTQVSDPTAPGVKTDQKNPESVHDKKPNRMSLDSLAEEEDDDALSPSDNDDEDDAKVGKSHHRECGDGESDEEILDKVSRKSTTDDDDDHHAKQRARDIQRPPTPPPKPPQLQLPTTLREENKPQPTKLTVSTKATPIRNFKALIEAEREYISCLLRRSEESNALLEERDLKHIARLDQEEEDQVRRDAYIRQKFPLRRGNTIFYLPPQWPSGPKTDSMAQTEGDADDAAAAKVSTKGILSGHVETARYECDEGGSTLSLDQKKKKKVSFGASETKIMTPEGKKKFFSADDLSNNATTPSTPTWTSQIVPRYLKKIVKRKNIEKYILLVVAECHLDVLGVCCRSFYPVSMTYGSFSLFYVMIGHIHFIS